MRHGTRTCYTHYGCRRPECKAAQAAYQKLWRNGPEPDEVRCGLCHAVWPRRHPATGQAVVAHLASHR